MSERVLIHAPRGRDAAVIEQVLNRSAIRGVVCATPGSIRPFLDEDVGALVITEEVLPDPAAGPLLQWCEHQPAWSDFPVIVLATRQAGRRSADASALLERLGNVVVLERPLNAETLLSAATSALRVRRRQYQSRALLQERERREQELRELNETLEQRVAERAAELTQAQETLAFALESAAMGSWDLDLQTGQSRRSLQHDRIFGFSSGIAEWGRDSFIAHVVPEDRALASAAFDAALSDGKFDMECRIRRDDEAIRWINAQGRVSYGPAGTPVRMAGIIMDTTERRLTEDALHQAQKMEAIGQLTGGVAHDFNNLLTVIVGGLDLIIRRPEQVARVVRLAEAAMTAARRGEQLTQQLLAFSRRQMLRPQTIKPDRLLREFEGLARRAVGEAVTLRFDVDAQTPAVRIDPAQFESAILNLIVNARDAMPGGGRVTVGCRGDEDGQVRISVSDTGEGMTPDTLAHAFEPFFTTKDVGKGSGLGLSQVYGFVRSAGGDVAIMSTPGSGTTVQITLPASNETPVAEPVMPAFPLRPATAGETVLLVEDDEEVLAMAVESMQELRYSVVVARNAHQALDHIRGPGRIDVIFSDVVMPGGMNGAELALEAKRLRPGLKVLLTSGYVGEVASQGTITNDVPLLTKPYRRDELAEKLSVVLGRA